MYSLLFVVEGST